MQFLGTGAAELVPNPFCECALCQKVRRGGDARDRRRRSALLLDARNLIDFGPDVPGLCGEFGVSLTTLRNVFLTHLHADHAALSSFEELLMSCTEPPQLHVYLSPEAYDSLLRFRDELNALPFRVHDHAFEDYERYAHPMRFEPFRDYDIDGMRVSAVYGAHDAMLEGERSLNYLFEKDGRRFFYALDTGYPTEAAYEYLRGRRLDWLVIDMTFGDLAISETSGHMSFDHFEKVLGRLVRCGAIDARSRIVFTHIGMECGMTHLELCEAARARFGAQVTIAYDGMRLDGPFEA